MLELAAVLVVVVLRVKRKRCLEAVSSHPSWTNMPQQSLWICVRVWVNFYRYWLFSSSEHIFFPPKCVSVVHSKWEMLQEPLVNVKASKLIIFTANSSVLVKLSFQSQIMTLFDLMIKFSSSIWFDLISSLFLLLLLGFLYSTTLFPFDLTLFSFPSSCFFACFF